MAKRSSDQSIDFYSIAIRNNKFDIYFDMNKPQLKFVLNNKYSKSTNVQQKYVELIKIIRDIANDMSLFSRSGSHICLQIPSTVNEIESFHEINEIDDDQLAEGYIRMSGCDFYHIHPLKDSFIENFEKNTNYIIET